MVKNLPAMQETRVQSLGLEDPLEEEMATHSSVLTWEIPWTEEPGGLQPMGSQRVGHNLVTNTLTSFISKVTRIYCRITCKPRDEHTLPPSPLDVEGPLLTF